MGTKCNPYHPGTDKHTSYQNSLNELERGYFDDHHGFLVAEARLQLKHGVAPSELHSEAIHAQAQSIIESERASHDHTY